VPELADLVTSSDWLVLVATVIYTDCKAAAVSELARHLLQLLVSVSIEASVAVWAWGTGASGLAESGEAEL
jgi:hypothetical protein